MKHSKTSTAIAIAVALCCVAGSAFAEGNRTGPDKTVQAESLANDPGVVVICSTELKELQIDPLTGRFVQARFWVAVQVTNASGAPVFEVEAAAIPMANQLKITGTNPSIIAARLDDGDPPVTAQWDAVAGEEPDSTVGEILFLIRYRDEHGNDTTRECTVQIRIPAIPRPVLGCALSTSVTNGMNDMTIDYDFVRADYEGEESTVGDYTVFTVTARIENLGASQARSVRAMLLLPENYTLEEGERAVEYLSPEDLNPAMSGMVSWKVRPIGSCLPATRTFEVLVTSENGDPLKCTLTVTLAPKGCLIQVALPNNAVGATGQKITVPVQFHSGVSDGIDRYRLMIGFDPQLVRFSDVISESSRTASGWRGPRTELLTSAGGDLPDVVMIDDMTLDRKSMIHLGERDTLVFLRFDVVFNPRFNLGSNDNVRQARMAIVPDRTFPSNRRIVSAFNSAREDSYEGVILAWIDGYVTVSSDCAVPLKADVLLHPNHPNPFNPSTSISYELKNEMSVKLVVLDMFGRELHVLDEGMREAGRHDVVFDAEDLPGGMYLYQVRTAAGMLTKRMLLLR
ncbi:MAG: T9SS type A sorting domain-containing protein [Bacteroidetes bacterium]|nr:T9SS type A sorting domain-containing protein [Bacteroidota bacterium]